MGFGADIGTDKLAFIRRICCNIIRLRWRRIFAGLFACAKVKQITLGLHGVVGYISLARVIRRGWAIVQPHETADTRNRQCAKKA